MLERKTCRDQNGGSRLMPGGNLRDAIEQLCIYDAAAYGVDFGLPKMPLPEGCGRKTYRTENCEPRLLPGVDLCDALDRLCKLEEATFGPLVIETAGFKSSDGKRCRDCGNYRPAARCGECAAYPARDIHGNITGPRRPVAPGRYACKRGFVDKQAVAQKNHRKD